MRSVPGIAFDYRPSRAVAAAVLLVTACGGLSPWLSDIPLTAKGLLASVAVASGLGATWRFLHPGFRGIAWGDAGWRLMHVSGSELAVELARQVRLGSLQVLEFTCGPRMRFHAILTPGNLDADTYRRLVVLLSRAESTAA